MGSLFGESDEGRARPNTVKEENVRVERLKELDNKITAAINKVKQLKEEKAALEAKAASLEGKLHDMEGRLAEKDEEIRRLSSEKLSIKDQIEDLLGELESIESN